MRTYPAHEDLGLVENDNTEDMRKAPAATEALRKTTTQLSRSKEIYEP